MCEVYTAVYVDLLVPLLFCARHKPQERGVTGTAEGCPGNNLAAEFIADRGKLVESGTLIIMLPIKVFTRTTDLVREASVAHLVRFSHT